ncbi:MAG: stage II sporulation protein M, partial [Anaerolineae bacterium]
VIALEAFVGEKERRSLEPLLSTPLTDMQLYLGKLFASTFVPTVASYVAIGFYTVLLRLSVGWTPNPTLFLLAVILATAQAFVMVSAAVVVSSQATTTRAANLVASFIIIPVAFLLQAEASLLFVGDYAGLWYVVLFLVITDVILVRMGVRVFDREHLLGRAIDQIDFVGGLRTFWQALWPGQGLKTLYRVEIPQMLRSLVPEIVVTVLVVFGGALWLGVWGSTNFALPPELANLPEMLDMEAFDQAIETSGILSSLSTWTILAHNTRALFFAALLGMFSLGTIAVLLLMLPLALIAYFTLQIPKFGIDPGAFLATFVLPHGFLELPAAILATAQAFRIGVIILRPPEDGGGVKGMIRELGRFVKLFVAVVLPLLLAAAWIEAEITPRLVIDFLNQL